jgi:hypothetical protein
MKPSYATWMNWRDAFRELAPNRSDVLGLSCTAVPSRSRSGSAVTGGPTRGGTLDSGGHSFDLPIFPRVGEKYEDATPIPRSLRPFASGAAQLNRLGGKVALSQI